MLYINLPVTVSPRQLSVANLKGNDITSIVTQVTILMIIARLAIANQPFFFSSKPHHHVHQR